LTTLLAAGLFPVEVLGEMISMGTLCAFMLVCCGVLYLRIKKPHLHRPFRTPLAPFVCTTGVLICGYLMVSMPAATWWRFALWIIVGIAIYISYGRRGARGRPESGHAWT